MPTNPERCQNIGNEPNGTTTASNESLAQRATAIVCSARNCLIAATVALASNPAIAQRDCTGIRDILLRNGAIHTMADAPERGRSLAANDATADEVVSSIRIIGDTIAAVGRGRLGANACTETIDLNGRTVVPGIIDNHNHIVLLGLRPGHDTRLESALSITDVTDIIAARAAALPAGEWVTAIGGFDIGQFAPSSGVPRFPTLAELDAAAPSNPVYIQQSFAGPAATNSLGKAFFEQRGVTVGPQSASETAVDDGFLAGGFVTPNPATEALFALRQLQTFDDRRRGTLDALAYSASLGVTTHLDQGGFPASGTTADGAAHFDRYRAYDALLSLHAEGALTNRIRLNYLHMETDPATPELQARLQNVIPGHGDGWLRVTGIGEFTAGDSPIIATATDAWAEGTRRVAEAGWRNENHSLTPGDFPVIIEQWETLHRSLPAPGLSELRWVVAHAPFITRDYAARLAAIGGGVSVLGGWRYISGTAEQNGPPFRMLAETGIPMGMSSDGMQISPLNPWLGLYYVITGRNARGELINGDQTLDRHTALALYTSANGWFLGEEDALGTLAPGKYADLVVLNADYFDPERVSDDEIRELHSVLTPVGGRIVHGSVDEL